MSAITDVPELLSRAARESPDRPALIDSAGRMRSFAELDDEVSRVASGLGAAGLVGGQRVLVVVGNRVEFVTTYLGVLRAQLVAVPVNPTTAADELTRILEDCGARLVVADGDTVATAREAVAALEGAASPRIVAVGAPPAAGERSYDDLSSGTAEPPLPVRDPESLAVLLYTGGTSGHPRAAMLSHRALVANIEQVAAVEPAMIRSDDVLLGVLPLFHVYGLNAVLGVALRQGARLVLVDHFDPAGVLDVIEREGVTVVPVAPPVFPHWLRVPDLARRLRSVRLVLSGSAPLAAETMERFTELSGVEVHQGYGLTEAAPVVTSTLIRPQHGPDDPAALPAPAGSVGAAVPGVELRLVDDTGSAPSGDDPGQIQIRGDNLFSGYWPDGSDGPDADGWWGTGDLGFLEASGDLFLVDRAGDVIVVSGFSVYPAEVEEVVAEVPGVDGAAVIGVPDEETGEAVVAYVRAPGADAAQVESAVLAHCVARLARFKQPMRVEVVDELPQTVSGRIQRGRVRMVERRRATGLLE